MPSVPNGCIAHIDTAFMQEDFYISQWEWKPHIQHNCELDDLRAGFEIAERYRIRHGWLAKFPIEIRQDDLIWQCLPKAKSYVFQLTSILSNKRRNAGHSGCLTDAPACASPPSNWWRVCRITFSDIWLILPPDAITFNWISALRMKSWWRINAHAADGPAVSKPWFLRTRVWFFTPSS